MDVTWHAFDWVTGRRGPQVTTRTLGSVSRVIGAPTSTSLDVLCWDSAAGAAVAGWEAATDPGRAMLVALDETERFLWGGMVTAREDTGGMWVSVAVTSPEGYLDRRYVGDYAATFESQTQIAADLLAFADETDVEVGDTTFRRDRTYLDGDDKTVLSAITELSEVINGPEFTCDLEWTDDTHTTLRRVWVVRDRIGRESAATFTMPGSITGYTFTEDYSSDAGANDVLAYSSGEGDARPESDHMVDVLPGWPRFEYRWSPSTSITDTATLDQHARRALEEMKRGRTQLMFEAHLSASPMPGWDFHLGDTVNVSISSPRFPAVEDVNGRVTAGLTTQVRMLGWEIDFDADRFVPVTEED